MTAWAVVAARRCLKPSDAYGGALALYPRTTLISLPRIFVKPFSGLDAELAGSDVGLQ